MSLSQIVRDRLSQCFGISRDEYNAAQELADAVDNIKALVSSAGAGGSASAALTVPGLLATDTIMSVSQKVAGANSLPLLGWTTVANNALTVQWSSDPGAGAVIVVAIRR